MATTKNKKSPVPTVETYFRTTTDLSLLDPNPEVPKFEVLSDKGEHMTDDSGLPLYYYLDSDDFNFGDPKKCRSYGFYQPIRFGTKKPFYISLTDVVNKYNIASEYEGEKQMGVTIDLSHKSMTAYLINFVEMLLEKHVSANVKKYDGRTPEHCTDVASILTTTKNDDEILRGLKVKFFNPAKNENHTTQQAKHKHLNGELYPVIPPTDTLNGTNIKNYTLLSKWMELKKIDEHSDECKKAFEEYQSSSDLVYTHGNINEHIPRGSNFKRLGIRADTAWVPCKKKGELSLQFRVKDLYYEAPDEEEYDQGFGF